MQFSIKYKAKSFDEIIGHKKITKEFIKRSKENNFAEVMFFIGEPGSGKTASASIIAKKLNCQTGKENCVCIVCQDIDNELFNRDVHLFNASKMGKEEVNKLEELVSYYPTYDKNIVIIIDEAHELRSVSAKGATKKLLEKKRDNVFYILCTSDYEAFTPEIKRRGQVYLFKEVSDAEIAEFLLNILKKEEIFETIDESFITEGLFTIASNCNGSPGYALSLIERCIQGEIYIKKDIISELGLVSNETSTNILEKLLKKDKSVFEDLKNVDLKEFFMKSNKILNDIKIYQLSGYSDQEWKIQGAKRLLNIGINNIDFLLEKFNNVKTVPYFIETSFYYEVTTYFNDQLENYNKSDYMEKLNNKPTRTKI